MDSDCDMYALHPYEYTGVDFDWVHEVKQVVRDKPKIGRNALCPCGSGKKFKKCCWKKEVE